MLLALDVLYSYLCQEYMYYYMCAICIKAEKYNANCLFV